MNKVYSKDSKIYIAGHRGMVGSACLRNLTRNGYTNLLTKKSNDLDLRNQNEVRNFIRVNKPEIIVIAAAKVGGILANDSYPYDFLMDNMLIQNNLIRYANEFNINKLIFLGSSCIYPKFAKQPISEKSLLTGSLESTNQWYAIAKISGVMLINSLRKQYSRDYISLMPSNLYGPNDNFDLKTSHVLPALIRKFHEAKIKNNKNVKLWGDGTPMREFMHVDDLAEAVKFSIENKLDYGLYNVGFSNDISIKDLANTIKKITSFNGEILWDESKPNGTPKKLMDSKKFNKLGWKPKIELENGIKLTYEWYKNKLINN